MHTPIRWIQGLIALAVERPEFEACHIHIPSGEVKNKWNYTSARLSSFMTCTGQFDSNVGSSEEPQQVQSDVQRQTNEALNQTLIGVKQSTIHVRRECV
jgi:hypothetical protein